MIDKRTRVPSGPDTYGALFTNELSILAINKNDGNQLVGLLGL